MNLYMKSLYDNTLLIILVDGSSKGSQILVWITL